MRVSSFARDDVFRIIIIVIIIIITIITILVVCISRHNRKTSRRAGLLVFPFSSGATLCFVFVVVVFFSLGSLVVWFVPQKPSPQGDHLPCPGSPTTRNVRMYYISVHVKEKNTC